MNRNITSAWQWPQQSDKALIRMREPLLLILQVVHDWNYWLFDNQNISAAPSQIAFLIDPEMISFELPALCVSHGGKNALCWAIMRKALPDFFIAVAGTSQFEIVPFPQTVKQSSRSFRDPEKWMLRLLLQGFEVQTGAHCTSPDLTRLLSLILSNGCSEKQ